MTSLIDLSDCPKFLRPRLRVFLSADIVGSTALKQTPFDPSADYDHRTIWFAKIQGFYFEAQRAFLGKCREQETDVPGSLGPEPEMWKTIGDEVLFVKEVTDHRQIIVIIRCWMRAVAEMRQFIKKDNARLDVKCTAWLAGFPFRNSEVVVSNDPADQDATGGEWFIKTGRILNRLYANGPEASVKIDYIGPSIDIGFRLGQFSSARKFIVSADIAYVLSKASPGEDVDDPVFKVYFDGPQPLKGVLGGVEYPIFWLDLSPADSLDRAQDKISQISSVNRDRLKDYLTNFYRTYSGYTNPPFVHHEHEQQISQRPDWYDAQHRKLVVSFNEGEAKIKDEVESITGQDPNSGVDAPIDLTNMSRFMKKLADLSMRGSKEIDTDK